MLADAAAAVDAGICNLAENIWVVSSSQSSQHLRLMRSVDHQW